MNNSGACYIVQTLLSLEVIGKNCVCHTLAICDIKLYHVPCQPELWKGRNKTVEVRNFHRNQMFKNPKDNFLINTS